MHRDDIFDYDHSKRMPPSPMTRIPSIDASRATPWNAAARNVILCLSKRDNARPPTWCCPRQSGIQDAIIGATFGQGLESREL